MSAIYCKPSDFYPSFEDHVQLWSVLLLPLSSSIYHSCVPWVSIREVGTHNVQALQRTGFLKLSHKVVLTPPPLNANFFFTNTVVTACSFFRSLKLNLRDAFWILGRQLNWNNCWQVVWKGCLSSGVFGFSKGGCVGWSVTAVSHTTNSFFKRLFFNFITGVAQLFKMKSLCCCRNVHLDILVLALQNTANFLLERRQHWICNYFSFL